MEEKELGNYSDFSFKKITQLNESNSYSRIIYNRIPKYKQQRNKIQTKIKFFLKLKI